MREQGSLSSDGLLVADDNLAALLTLSDPSLLDDLAEHRLAPLEGLTEGARERLEATLLAWLDHQGVVRDAAEELHVHPQTVRYRIAQLRELFGDELDRPESRYELLLVVQRTIIRLALPGGKPREKAPPYRAAEDPALQANGNGSGNGHVSADREQRVLAAFP